MPLQNETRPLHVDMPTEPPKDVLAQTFSDDPSLSEQTTTHVDVQDKHGDTVQQVAVKPADLPELSEEEGEVVAVDGKPAEKVKQEPAKKKETTDFLKPPGAKKDEGKVTPKEGEKKEVIKQITPPAKKDDTFDYTGFSAEETVNLKNMSRQSREYAASLIKENKELGKLKDSTYLQNPDAYVLHPEFRQAQEDLQYASQEAQFLQQQLALVKQGKDYRVLKGFHKDTGAPVFSEEMKPTDNTEEEIRMALNNLSGSYRGFQQKVQEFPKKYQQGVQADLQQVEAERKSRFAWVADPKLLDHTVEIEGAGDVPIKDVKATLINYFPVYMRSHPAVQVASDIFVAMQIQAAMLREAQASTQVAEIKVQETRRGEPSSQTKPAKPVDAGVGGVKEFSMEGMPT